METKPYGAKAAAKRQKAIERFKRKRMRIMSRRVKGALKVLAKATPNAAVTLHIFNETYTDPYTDDFVGRLYIEDFLGGGYSIGGLELPNERELTELHRRHKLAKIRLVEEYGTKVVQVSLNNSPA